jgi:hypothetical protein
MLDARQMTGPPLGHGPDIGANRMMAGQVHNKDIRPNSLFSRHGPAGEICRSPTSSLALPDIPLSAVRRIGAVSHGRTVRNS